MAIYGQTLGVFKREINEFIRNEERTKLHKIKIVVFWLYKYGAMTHISSPITSLWRHNDVIRDEIRVIAPRMLKPKNYNFDFMQFGFFSFANSFIVFAFKYPLSLTIYGHVAGNLNFLITCNFKPFHPIEMGFSL